MHLCIPSSLCTHCIRMHVTHASDKSNDSRIRNVSARTRLVHAGHYRYSRFQYEGAGRASKGGNLSGANRILMLDSVCKYRKCRVGCRPWNQVSVVLEKFLCVGNADESSENFVIIGKKVVT